MPDLSCQQMETTTRKEWARSRMQVGERLGRDSTVQVSLGGLMGMNSVVRISSVVLESHPRGQRVC